MSSAQEALPTSPYFTLECLADGVYAAIIAPGMGAWGNAGILNLGDATLVFDTFLTPGAARDLRRVAEQVTGQPVRYVVNSHYHMDHIHGNQVFENAVILATERTRELLADRGAELIAQVKAHPEYPDSFDELIQQAPDEARRRDLVDTQREYRALNDDRGELTLRLPDITFEQSLTLHGSQRTAQLLCYGGGHTPSDAFLYLPAERIAFLGDLVSVQTHPSFYGDADAWMGILDRLAQLDIQRLVPGHGAVGTPANIRAVRQYIADLAALTAADIAGAIDIPAAYADWAAPTTFDDNIGYFRQRQQVQQVQQETVNQPS